MSTPWITLLGGICLLIYGLNMTKDNLQTIAGDRLRYTLEKLTDNRIISFFTGFFMTLMFQSSSACIAMTVGFASASLLTLLQAMAIILGADVATTLTVQLIAFNISSYSLLILVIGFFIMMSFKDKASSFGLMIMGIGFIFLGMWTMSQASLSFKDSNTLLTILALLKNYPFVSLVIAIMTTAVLQSSAAFLAILLSLAHADVMPLTQAIPLIIGANIGGCALPVLVSLHSTDRGRQVALAHVFLKVAGAILIFPFLTQFESWVIPTAADLSRQIANAHFIFNAALAVLFLPFINLGARLISWVYPVEPQPEPFGPKFLDPQVLSTPSFALGQAKRETLRMASITQEMLDNTMHIIKKEDPLIAKKLKEMENKCDILYRAIKRYLVAISQQTLSKSQATQQSALSTLIKDLEDIGDTIDRSILPLVTVKIKKPLKFSEEGFAEIKSYFSKVQKNFQLTLSAFTNNDISLYKKVLKNKDSIQRLELKLRETHLDRLRRGVKESMDTSALHLELLSQFRRINSSISNIAYQETIDEQTQLL